MKKRREFIKDEHTYMNPAVGLCSCSKEVILVGEHAEGIYGGTVQCECGRWYNLFGQELRDPKYWEDDEY